MFERYTEKARRVIFFARYESSQFGSQSIETEHILLGLVREDKALTNRLLRSAATVETIRREIEKHTTIREKISTSVDLPLSDECKRVLAYAAEEADRLAHKHIGTEHLLLGLLREEGGFAARILRQLGIEVATVRVEFAKTPPEQMRSFAKPSVSGTEVLKIAGVYTDLTQQAVEGELASVVERDVEVESMIEVLCRKERRNPMLLGARGVGKAAIVAALAQRIVDGKVPQELADKRVLAISSELVAAWAPNQEKFEDLARVVGATTRSANLILFVDGLHGMVLTPKKNAVQEFAGSLRFAMQVAGIRCIGATTEENYVAGCAAYPVLDKVFRPLHVKPLDAAGAMAVLRVRKENLELFHEVTFGDDALECAVQRADSYLKEKLLPGKALELLDGAGAAVKVRQAAWPNEVVDTKKRLDFAQERENTAIANHEFEKARFYSDEAKREKENLSALKKRFGLEDTGAATVTRADVEQLITRWNAYPYSQQVEK